MGINSGQTIALTTDDKVGMLRRAWNLAPDTANTLLEQIQSLIEDAQAELEEDLNNSASNSHSSSSNVPGSNSLTDQENVRAWNQIIDGIKQARLYLSNCAKYGLDAFAIFAQGCFPTPLPHKINDPTLRVVVDDGHDQWEQLCDLESIPLADVVGATVDDEAVYLWLLAHTGLLNRTNNRSESRGFYGHAIIGRTGGGF